MQGREEILKGFIDPDDRKLAAHALDRIERAKRGELTHIGFLDPRLRGLLEPLLRRYGVYRFDLGEERALCLLLADYMADLEPEALRELPDYPALALKIKLRKSDGGLSHRDYLGTLMAQGVRRNAIGDLFVTEEGCTFPVLREIAGHIMANVDRVGGVGADVHACSFNELSGGDIVTRAKRGTVASMRLDAVAGEVFNLSRTQAREAVRAGVLMHNRTPGRSPTDKVCEGDRLSMRTRGCVRITSASGLTKKGKIPLEWEVYI